MLVMCSSDARPRYVSDIAMVLATPTGVRFQFRYQSRYFSPEVQRRIGENSLVGVTALVCFIGNRGQGDMEFLVPVRLAKVCVVEKIGDAYVFSMEAAGYPDLGKWSRAQAEIILEGSKIVKKMIADSHGEYYAVNWDESGSIGSKAIGGTEGWAGIAERILRLSTFKNSYLLRVELADSDGSPLCIKADDSGWLKFDPRSSYRVRVWFYGNSVDFGNRAIRLETNGEVLSSISDQKYVVRSRYDQVDFWFTPKVADQAKRTLLRLVSSPADSSDNADVGTEVELRCLVTRPLGPRVCLAILGGVSAAVVAVPGLIGDAVPIGWRILIAAVGALGVALGASLR